MFRKKLTQVTSRNADATANQKR